MEPRALARRGNPAPFFSKKSDNDIILFISRWQTCSSLVDWVSLRSTLMCQLKIKNPILYVLALNLLSESRISVKDALQGYTISE